MKPQITIVNVQTGEETVREMNDSEFQQYEKDQADAIARAENQASVNAAKENIEPTIAEKLALVGLSIDELKAALGV